MCVGGGDQSESQACGSAEGTRGKFWFSETNTTTSNSLVKLQFQVFH